MTGEIYVTDVEEHEDGSATIHFDLPEDAQKVFVELGLKLALYLHVYDLLEGDVWDWMESTKND
jgi:hypothetical protein